MDILAGDLLSLLDHLKIRRCAIAGLSMGGYAAFRMYEKAKEIFSCMILADTRAEPDFEEGKEKRLTLINIIRKGGIKPFNDIFIKGLLSRDCLENRQHLVNLVYSLMAEMTPSGAINTLYGLMERPDSRSLLPEIACPVLLIVGENDILTPSETALAMHRAIRNSKMTIIPGAGHLSNIESPSRFNNELIEFLIGI